MIVYNEIALIKQLIKDITNKGNKRFERKVSGRWKNSELIHFRTGEKAGIKEGRFVLYNELTKTKYNFSESQ